MKILLVDDHPMFLAGLREALRHGSAVDCIVSAETAEAAFNCLEQHSDFDWIVLDIELPGCNGFDFMEELMRRHEPTPVVVLSAHEDAATVSRALSAGARGYISKASSADELARAFEILAQRQQYVSPALKARLEDFRTAFPLHGALKTELTRRQRQVLDLVCDGASNAEIGPMLGITESTAKGHVSTLYSLLNATNRTTCVKEAKRLGLVG